MNNRQVCIPKQTFFISLVVVLIAAYVVVAYRTINTTTSTNSRASGSQRSVQVLTPTFIPRDCTTESCIDLTNPVVNSKGGIQFVNPTKNINSKDQNATYAVFAYIKNSPPNLAKQLFTILGKDLDVELKNFNFQNIGITTNNIQNMEFKLFKVK